MKKNKLLFRALCTLLALMLCICALASCQDKQEEESSSSDGSETTPEEFDYENAEISKYLSISKNDYTNITVTLDDIYTISDDDVREQIDAERFENKKKTNGDTKVTDQPVRLGDSAYIYYTGYLNGEPFEGGSNESATSPSELSIGSGSFIDGFEEGLIGVVPNQTSKDAPHELSLTFPEDYYSKDLAGKSVIFKVWIAYTVQYEIPEFTDSYVKDTLDFAGSAKEYEAYVKKAMQSSADSAKVEQTIAAVTSLLLENSTVVSYPEESVNYWTETYTNEIEYYMSYYQQMGYKFESIDEFAITYFGLKEGDDWMATLTEYAKATVHEKLLIYAIAEAEGFTVSDEDYKSAVQFFIDGYAEQTGKTYTSTEIESMIGRSAIRERAIYDKVSSFLVSNCKVEYKKAD